MVIINQTQAPIKDLRVAFPWGSYHISEVGIRAWQSQAHHEALFRPNYKGTGSFEVSYVDKKGTTHRGLIQEVYFGTSRVLLMVTIAKDGNIKIEDAPPNSF